MVREAVALHKDLTLIAIEGVKSNVKLPGLKFMSQTANGEVTYRVNPAYALFLSGDLKKAALCSKSEVYQVHFMFEESDQPGELIHTGVTCVSEDASLRARPLNAYNKFAQLLIHNLYLREKILNDMFEFLYFTVKADGTTRISFKERAVPVALASATSSVVINNDRF